MILDAPVRHVRWSDEGVEVDAGAVRATARGTPVVAIPPNLTGAIRFDPPLPAWSLKLEAAISQGSVVKVLAGYEEPFWRADGLSGEGFAPAPRRARAVRQLAAFG